MNKSDSLNSGVKRVRFFFPQLNNFLIQENNNISHIYPTNSDPYHIMHISFCSFIQKEVPVSLIRFVQPPVASAGCGRTWVGAAPARLLHSAWAAEVRCTSRRTSREQIAFPCREITRARTCTTFCSFILELLWRMKLQEPAVDRWSHPGFLQSEPGTPQSFQW